MSVIDEILDMSAGAMRPSKVHCNSCELVKRTESMGAFVFVWKESEIPILLLLEEAI